MVRPRLFMDQNSSEFKVADKPFLSGPKPLISNLDASSVIRSFFVILFIFSGLAAQEKSKPSPAANGKPGYVLSVKAEPILNLSLKADKSSLRVIASDLSKRLKVPVLLSPAMKSESVSIEFSELPLEAALQLLAPHVYVDYEVETGSGSAPKPLGVFLYDAEQGEPPVTSVVPGTTQSILIEGDTEEGVEPTTDEDKKKLEERPLRVQFRDGVLSIKAKKQPLVLVLLKIGEELGIPVDIQNQSNETVDTEISKAPIEDALRRLSPNIRVFIRADLTRGDRRALRLVLSNQATSSQ